jgi:thiosulfate/3-mercaptopyruvate sulfurtransferase
MFLNLSCVMLLFAAGADTETNRYPRADLLIEAAEFANPQAAGKVRILDARGKPKYNAGHIPGAVWVDHTTWARAFDDGQDTKAWAKRIGALGIDVETRVVIYDANRSKDAARVWWILRYWGVRDVRLLNGGWKAWQDAKGKTEKDTPKIAEVDAKLAPQAKRHATKAQMLDAVKEKKLQIVDARSLDEYCGTEKMAKRNGAIPGALHLEWSDAVDKKTERFKSPAELAKILKNAGIDPTRPSATYCQSGGRAAVMAFTLELMGAKDVRNYYKSWAEWGNDDETPIVQPKKK